MKNNVARMLKSSIIKPTIGLVTICFVTIGFVTMYISHQVVNTIELGAALPQSIALRMNGDSWKCHLALLGLQGYAATYQTQNALQATQL